MIGPGDARSSSTYEGDGDLVKGLLEFGLRGKVGHGG